MTTVRRSLTVTFSNGKKLELQGPVDADLDKKLRSVRASEMSENSASALVDSIFKNHRLGAGEQLAATAIGAAAMLGRTVKAVQYAGVDSSGKDFARSLGLQAHAGRELRAVLNEELCLSTGKGTATVLQILAGEVVLDPAQPSAVVEPVSSRTPLPKKEWTIVVYYSGDNDLAPYGLADLKEMKDGFAKVSSFANVVVIMDNPLATGPTPGLSEGFASPTQVLVLEHDKKATRDGVRLRPVQIDGTSRLGKLLERTGGHLNMASGDSLRASREFAARFAPSKHTMMVLSGHGEGPAGAMSDDSSPSPDDLLKPHELHSALTTLPKPVDVLAFDACMMQDAGMAEVASAVGAKLLVASEEIEPQRGWQWRKLFESMARRRKNGSTLKPADLGRAAVDTYSGNTLSCVDASRATTVWSGLDELGTALRKAGGREQPDIAWAINNAERYDVDADTVDIIDFCKQLCDGFARSSEVYKAARALIQTVESAVLRHSTTASRAARDYENSHGLAMYLPATVDGVDPRQAGRLIDHKATDWVKFLKGA
ncbi:MAG: clostripain-related cysteine peptidase [Pseudomonadota bacterium]